MISPADPREPAWQRHHLVFLCPDGWHRLLDTRTDLSEEPLIVSWVDRGWPLIVRRADIAANSDGLSLGLPLPPSHGKRRVALILRPEDVVETRPPPLLDEARVVAPELWAGTLDRISALAASFGTPARVFGGLAWQWITGLPYLTATSDVDLLLPCATAAQIGAQTAGLASIAAAAPMRIDGELVRPDGAAVNWREMHGGADEILVKTTAGASMLDRGRFLDGLPP